MNTFDPMASGDRERPAPDDPEAQFYPPYTTPVDHQEGPQGGPQSGPFHHHHHHHPGYGPDDPDGYAHSYGGWRGGPQPWQPWAWQGRPWGRRRHRGPHIWKFALLLLLIILFIKPALAFTFALAGLALTILLVLLPFIILGMIFGRHRGWHHGWGQHGWHHRGGPWDRGW
jgi:hypothetical protein